MQNVQRVLFTNLIAMYILMSTEAIKKKSMSQTHLVKKLSAMLFFLIFLNELSPMRFFYFYFFTAKAQCVCTL